MKLVPISVNMLYDGLLVNFGIYAYQNKRFSLLCQDVILNENTISSLQKTVGAGRNVYIPQKNRDFLLYETSYFKTAQQLLEKKIGYDKLKNMARDFLERANDTGTIPCNMVTALANDILDKLATFDSALITQCLNSIRNMDEYLYIHSLNVGFLNAMIAGWCGLDHETCIRLTRAGLVHDLGKLRISPSILNKPGKLTPLEYEAIKRHPEFGCRILESSGETDPIVLDVALHHHERINGTGYPDKQDHNLSVGARITAISDIYDAMIAERPYKDASTPFIILQELADASFAGLDMSYVQTMLKNMTKELTGHPVLLSNGALAKIEYISEKNPRYPIVNVDGEIIKTDDETFCTKICPGNLSC